MGIVIKCEVCPRVAKDRGTVLGDYAYPEMERIPEGVGSTCGKCAMMGISTLYLQEQVYDEQTGLFDLKVRLANTSYDKFPVPGEIEETEEDEAEPTVEKKKTVRPAKKRGK